ncbi:MAG: hypothetical protein DBO98_03685 [Candidatus Liberibacter europaeus]|nr:hypothetical protein [Candidatus Liberibacter europaeus]
MFTGSSCGPYFLVNFGTKMRDINMLSLLIAFTIMGICCYNFMLLLEDLSKSTNSTDIRSMIMNIQPKYTTACTWLFYIYFVIVLIIMGFMAKKTLDGFGFIPDNIQYGLISAVLLLCGTYRNLLIEGDVLLNIIKFTFVASFIVAGTFFCCSNPEFSILKQNISLGTDSGKTISGLLFAMACFGGMENILHIQNDMYAKDFRRAIRLLPLIVCFISISVILLSGSIFTSEEQGFNLIPMFFKSKLDLTLISRIELTLMLIMQFSSIMTLMYLASKAGELCLPKLITKSRFGISSCTLSIFLIAFFTIMNNILSIFEIVMCIIWMHFPILHILKSRKLKQPMAVKSILFTIIFSFLLVKNIYDLIT